MHRHQPRNKICFQNKENPHSKLIIKKLNKKKWNILKKNIKFKINLKKKPEKIKDLFKERLKIKQQFSVFYGCIPEYQLKNIYSFFKTKKNKLHSFILFLETRLDIILFRLHFANSIFHAKQLINHGKIKVNNKYIRENNYQLKEGDLVEICSFLGKEFKSYKVPSYLERNWNLKTAVFIRKPFFQEIEYPFFLNLSYLYEYLKKN